MPGESFPPQDLTDAFKSAIAVAKLNERVQTIERKFDHAVAKLNERVQVTERKFDHGGEFETLKKTVDGQKITITKWSAIFAAILFVAVLMSHAADPLISYFRHSPSP